MQDTTHWKFEEEKDKDFFDVVTPPHGPTPEPSTPPRPISLLESLDYTPTSFGILLQKKRKPSKPKRKGSLLAGQRTLSNDAAGEDRAATEESDEDEFDQPEASKTKTVKLRVTASKITKPAASMPRIVQRKVSQSKDSAPASAISQDVWTPSFGGPGGSSQPKCPACVEMKSRKRCTGGPPCGVCIVLGRSKEECLGLKRDEMVVDGVRVMV